MRRMASGRDAPYDLFYSDVRNLLWIALSRTDLDDLASKHLGEGMLRSTRLNARKAQV
jgi:hypothetical protein